MFRKNKKKNGKSHGESGFTLIEMIAVMAIISVTATIAVPKLTAARARANEVSAIQALKSMYSAQFRLKLQGTIDANHDGVGEFGFLQEISGVRAIRSNPGERLDPAFFSAAYGAVDVGGRVQRSGFYFHAFLPGAGAVPLGEGSKTAAYPAVDGEFAQGFFAVYAWPVSYGRSGTRAFFINQEGSLLASPNDKTRYSGAVNSPSGMAAYINGATAMTSSIANRTVANDGQTWVEIQ
jgi:prepilin-type N-terminal cleavage/methylation domain-containing protein